MKSGVYIIKNNLNNKFYLGVSKDFKDRFRHHKSDLRLNKHHSILLQRAVNKYGIENFSFEILLRSPVEYLYKLEEWFLKEQKPSYNVAVKSEYYIDRKPRKHTEETKQKMRDFWTQEKRIENGIKTKNRKLGKSLSEETKLKISKGNSKLSDDEISKIKILLRDKQLKGKEIAKMFNVSPQIISQINKNKTHVTRN